jgi:hypothetical protein
MFRDLPPAAAWRHEGARDGFETMFASVGENGVRLLGSTAAVEEGEPWFVHYDLMVDAAWCTRRAAVSTWSRLGASNVVIEGDGAGNWIVDGTPRSELVGCLDVDLESSVCTNTLPVHRLRLASGDVSAAPAAWVRAADASVERLEQSYRRLVDRDPGQTYHYESPTLGFVAQLSFDGFGLAVDYPGIATRVH